MLKLLTVEEKAAELSVSTETLRRWRHEGRGPTYVQHASVIRYFPEPSREEAEAKAKSE